VYPNSIIVELTIDSGGRDMISIDLSEQFKPESLIILNEDKVPLPFELDGTHLIIYTLNSSKVMVVYEVKDGITYNAETGIWSITVNPKTPCKIILPKNAVALQFPTTGKVHTEDGRVIIELESPGSYTLKFTINIWSLMSNETTRLSATSTPLTTLESKVSEKTSPIMTFSTIHTTTTTITQITTETSSMITTTHIQTYTTHTTTTTSIPTTTETSKGKVEDTYFNILIALIVAIAMIVFIVVVRRH